MAFELLIIKLYDHGPDQHRRTAKKLTGMQCLRASLIPWWKAEKRAQALVPAVCHSAQVISTAQTLSQAQLECPSVQALPPLAWHLPLARRLSSTSSPPPPPAARARVMVRDPCTVYTKEPFPYSQAGEQHTVSLRRSLFLSLSAAASVPKAKSRSLEQPINLKCT